MNRLGIFDAELQTAPCGTARVGAIMSVT